MKFSDRQTDKQTDTINTKWK